MVLPFVYLCSIGAGFFASYLAVVQQIGYVSSGGFFLIFWQFQNPPDLLYSLIKAMAMAIVIVIVGCYYGYNASGGPVGVGTATAKSMVLNLVSVHLIGMLGTQLFWGANPTSTDRRLNGERRPAQHLGSERASTAPRRGVPRWSSRRRSARSRSRARRPMAARSRRCPIALPTRTSAAQPRTRRNGRANGSGESGSRVSVVDEAPPRPPPDGVDRATSTSGTPTRSIRRAGPTRSSSSTPTSRSGAPTSCAD